MNLAQIMAPEGMLLNVLEEFSPLAWRTYQARNPKVWNGDASDNHVGPELPPAIGFRFQKETRGFIQLLEKAIVTFHGKVPWSLTARKRMNLPGFNWLIAPKKLQDVAELARAAGFSSSKYLAAYDPSFVSLAYEDLGNLAVHIERILRDKLSEQKQ